MYKTKIILFIFFIICLISIVFIDLFGLSLSLKSVSEIKQGRTLKENLIDNLKINGINTIYDKENNIYFYNISEKYKGNKYILNLNLNGYKYKLINYNYNIIKVDYNTPIKIIIFNDKYYYETKIIITNLPLININVKDEIAKEDVKAYFTYINSSSKIKEVKNNTIIHVRGASSSIFDKKSYRIRFYNDDYTKKVNINIQEFYNDDSFILQSVYRDSSKIRDNLATGLWNDISNDFKDEDINSKYVELFINNEYKGLYLFSEPVNRKKLNLNKNSSIVIKSTDWINFKTIDDYSNLKSNYFNGYEIKYPDDEEMYNKVWTSFLNRVSDYYNPKVDNTYSVVKNTFNINNYIDMIIFNSFTNNIDSNMNKNLYYYMKDFDGLVYLEPWDLEFTFGYRHSIDADSVNDGKLIDDEKEVKLPMFSNEKKLDDKIIKRYWHLREDILTEEYFNNKLDKYLSELKYASKRDSDTWYKYNFNEEIERIRDWVNTRIIIMDEYVRGYSNGI